jgi:membrane protease YdiL (CAAX protease family)
MATSSDLIFVALFAVIGPLVDYATFWPAQRRLAEVDPVFVRRWTWKSAIGNPWILVGFGVAIWLAHGRDWASFGFVMPEGRDLWFATAFLALPALYYAYAIVALARSAEARASVRPQLAPMSDYLPHDRGDMLWFAGVSLTAGFTEEFLFRGYFIRTFAPWLGWWGAAALSLAIFALAHFYQGWSGVLRCAIFGAIFTLAYALTHSLWIAIALHALVDLSNGLMAWVVLRERATVKEETENG